MNTFSKLGICSCLFFFLNACGSDVEKIETAASSAEVSFAENPSAGFEIDRLSTRIPNGSNFRLALESHAKAFEVSSSGQVTVREPLLFDFERNPLITAFIDYDTSEGTEQFELRVFLENGDDLLHFLSDSKGAYQLANPGQWIKITEAEYEHLAENLSELYYCGSTKEQYELSFVDNPDGWQSGSYTVANNNGADIPAGGYVFAFRYDIIPNVSKIDIDDTQLKISTEAVDRGYQDFTGPLPIHSLNDSFFLLKGNDTPLSTVGYLGLYKDTNVLVNSQFITEEYYLGMGNVADLDQVIINQKALKYQGLATTIKQWD